MKRRRGKITVDSFSIMQKESERDKIVHIEYNGGGELEMKHKVIIL